MNYYNEIDKYAAQWIRNLIAAGHIAPGEVDERSISDVRPSDLVGYTQCHFFAGIGGWSLALRLAGWPDDRPVWTGSCPCQPFSVAGQGAGTADERHLWPHWFHLVRALRPPTVFGEQVDAAINHGWLDLVQDDLEGEGYAFGAVGVPAAGVGAPHIRQRLWFVAESNTIGRRGRGHGDSQWDSGSLQTEGRGTHDQLADSRHQQHAGRGDPAADHNRRSESGSQPWSEPASRSSHDQLADSLGQRRVGQHALLRTQDQGWVGEEAVLETAGSGEPHELAHAQHDGGRSDQQEREAQGGVADGWPSWLANNNKRLEGREPVRQRGIELAAREDGVAVELGDSAGTAGQWNTGAILGAQAGINGSRFSVDGVDSQRPEHASQGLPWSRADWLPCRDGKWRPVEPGTFPLAHGVSNRVGRLRAYGNAIVPQVAEQVIRAYMECRPC